jgi:hypothetical protein
MKEPSLAKTYRITDKNHSTADEGAKYYGKPGSAIRLSETVKMGEGQHRDTHPDDN